MQKFSPKVKKSINRILKKYHEEKGNAISLLQDIQEEFGYIPEKIVDWFSKRLEMPESHFFGVITFYSQFYLQPRGRNNIQVCLGTACYAKGAENILSNIENGLQIKVGDITKDKNFSLEAIRCLGACGLAPVLVIGQDFHGSVKARNVKKIIGKYNA